MTDNNKPKVNSEEYLAAQQEIIKAITHKPKIYVFINSGRETNFIQGIAVAEDATIIARHISSSECFFKHDMGLTSDWKHDLYKEKYPAGFELVLIEDPLASTDPGFLAMVKLARERQTR